MIDFIKIDSSYRPIPFWSWNEKLLKEETGRQIDRMKEAGIGGYFMHARGGLQTEYMSEEWFENIEEGITRAKKKKMSAWVYDENGWPSGFGNGKINGMGIRCQQKYLRMERCGAEKIHTDQTICSRNGYHFYYEVNPYYVDTLDADVTAAFLKEVYEPYYKRFGNTFSGFFTDEPQVSRNGIPWSFVLEDEYKRVYGEELLDVLGALFIPEGDYKHIRIRFWKLVTDLFSQNYMKQIYDWCHSRGLEFTGHLTLEESLEAQITAHGACMPNYEYFDMPGMDWLGRNKDAGLAQLQMCSAAHQLGKKRILTETFALCGHNAGFEELKGILEWQMIRGVNVFCPHLQGYSMRGIRKRDYPPAVYFQQPWWEQYKIFVDAMSRIGMILGNGEVHYDTLVIHPQTLAWTMFDGKESSSIKRLEEALSELITVLDKKHIPFHFGDEIMMERHAKAVGKVLQVGRQQYKRVILFDSEVLLDSTKGILEQYRSNGGELIVLPEWAGEADEKKMSLALMDIRENAVADNENILYTARYYPDYTVHYFVNSLKEEQPARIYKGSLKIDPITGLVSDFEGMYIFEPEGSLLVLEVKGQKGIPEGEWKIESITDNTLLLDFCDYYFDGELVEKNGYVLNIQSRACSKERPVTVRKLYRVEADFIPDRIFLGCETPEIFDIIINGVKIDKKDAGYFADYAIRLLDIHALLKKGMNTLEFITIFRQPVELYQNLKKAAVFESEKNKITYETEIEPVYLIGDFRVRTDGIYRKTERNAVKYEGNFVLMHSDEALRTEHIEKQGYPFFCGTIELSKKFPVINTDKRYLIKFIKKSINVIKLRINDGEEKVLLWGENTLDITKWVKSGENTVHLTLINNLRNLMGPHHLKEGECYFVSPGSFFKEPCIWNQNAHETWDDSYCFVETGIKIEII